MNMMSYNTIVTAYQPCQQDLHTGNHMCSFITAQHMSQLRQPRMLGFTPKNAAKPIVSSSLENSNDLLDITYDGIFLIIMC